MVEPAPLCSASSRDADRPRLSVPPWGVLFSLLVKDSRKPPAEQPASKPKGIPEPYERVTDVEGEATTVFRPDRGLPPGFHSSPLELTVHRARGGTHTDTEAPWVAVEVWTLNRIYLVGGRMHCIGVHKRSEHRDEPDHPLLGALLTGGRRQAKEDVELSQPFPLPGMKAVFRYEVGARSKPRFATTSAVERVVLRLGVTTLEGPGAAGSFHELTARFFIRTV